MGFGLFVVKSFHCGGTVGFSGEGFGGLECARTRLGRDVVEMRHPAHVGCNDWISYDCHV